MIPSELPPIEDWVSQLLAERQRFETILDDARRAYNQRRTRETLHPPLRMPVPDAFVSDPDGTTHPTIALVDPPDGHLCATCGAYWRCDC